MATVGQLVVNLLGNTAPFKRAFSEIPGFLGGITGRVAGLIGVGGGLGAIGTGVKLAADAEQMQVAFETMLGSASRAKSMIGELRQYAQKSPFSEMGVTEAAQMLLNYKVNAEQVMPTMRMLGDIAAGDQQKLEGLTRAFGQMSSAGKLNGQDLNQMINAGFNPLAEISDRTGESMGALRARMEAGAIGINEVRQAMVDATSIGGRFYQMTERQSQTLTGKFSTMKDEITNTLRSIGQTLIETFDFNAQVESATATLAMFREWISASGRDVIIFGGAVLGFVGALGAVSAAMRLATIWTAIWKSILSPAGFAMVVAGIVGATFAVAALDEMFNSSSQRAIQLSKNTAEAAANARELANSGKNSAPINAGALGQQIDRLRKIREELATATSSNFRFAKEDQEKEIVGRIQGLLTFSAAVDKSMEHVNNLHQMLTEARAAADQIGENSKVSDFAYEIERQIGLVSGFTDKMHKLNQEISGMSQIDRDALELSQKGATHDQVAEFRSTAEQSERLKQLRTARDQLVKQVESPSDAFRKQLDDLHDMRKAGLIDEETFARGRDLASKEFAKDDLAKDGGAKERQSRPLEALLRDSKAAQDAIARGMMAGKDSNPNKKLETLSERQAKASERAAGYLEQIASIEPEERQEVDF